jgi:hypothetical protein
MGLGTGALAGAGIGAAAYGAYSWGKDAVTAQEERSEIVQRARLGVWITTPTGTKPVCHG